ncbi:MAG: type II toxin-antitoxin system VapC family toxin [Nanoarchaeota archaeon]
METSICLDTGIVVDILRREEKAITWLKQVKRDRPIAITLITVFEIYRGIYISKNSLQESEAFEYLKKQLLVLPLVEKHVREAARISIILQKEGNSIDMQDLLIGICAREEGYALKTNNLKHFVNIPDLKLLT